MTVALRARPVRPSGVAVALEDSGDSGEQWGTLR